MHEICYFHFEFFNYKNKEWAKLLAGVETTAVKKLQPSK
jgi:hypothetical protein